MAPGDGELPKFSSLNCVSQVGRITAYMPEADFRDLKMLLGILSFFPGFMLAALFRLIEFAPSVPGPLGGLFRTIRLGMRGLIMTLYYADPRVLKVVGYEVSVYTGDR
jgi:hypothetical protein